MLNMYSGKIFDYNYEEELNEVKDIYGVDDQDYMKDSRINDGFKEYTENSIY